MTRDVEINFNHIKFTIISHFMFIYFDNISLCIKIYINIYLRVPRTHVLLSLRGRGFLLKYKIYNVFRSTHGMSWKRN